MAPSEPAATAPEASTQPATKKDASVQTGAVAPENTVAAEPETTPSNVSHGTGNPNVIRIAIVDGGVTTRRSRWETKP